MRSFPKIWLQHCQIGIECKTFFLPNSSLVTAVQKLSNNGPITEDYVDGQLNVQFQCHKSEQGQGCGENNVWVYVQSD